MSKAKELKPCVFCSSVNLTVFDQPCIAWVQCGDCEADGPPKDTAAEAIDAWNRAPASSEQQSTPRVQWWLAAIDMHGNPTLTDGAHGDRAGADRAAYLINAMGLGAGKRYAVACVELSTPNPNSDGVNHAAVAQCRRASLG